MTPLDWLLEPLSYDFMTRALVTTVIAAVVCALLSCWLVLIGWSLMGDAVSHAVLPGVVIAYILGVPFAIGAVVFGFLAVGMIGLVRGTSRVKEDAAIGIVFTTLFALGLVLISVTPSQTDLNHILFGNLLGVTDQDLIQVAILSAVTVVIAYLKRRDLTVFAFDPMHARSVGISPQVIGALLLTLLAITVVAALQAVGITLVVSMLIIPGVSARLFTSWIWHMLWISPLIAMAATVLGVFVSYALDTSTGGTIVLAQALFFALAYCFAPQGLIARYRRRR